MVKRKGTLVPNAIYMSSNKTWKGGKSPGFWESVNAPAVHRPRSEQEPRRSSRNGAKFVRPGFPSRSALFHRRPQKASLPLKEETTHSGDRDGEGWPCHSATFVQTKQKFVLGCHVAASGYLLTLRVRTQQVLNRCPLTCLRASCCLFSTSAVEWVAPRSC